MLRLINCEVHRSIPVEQLGKAKIQNGRPRNIELFWTIWLIVLWLTLRGMQRNSNS